MVILHVVMIDVCTKCLVYLYHIPTCILAYRDGDKMCMFNFLSYQDNVISLNTRIGDPITFECKIVSHVVIPSTLNNTIKQLYNTKITQQNYMYMYVTLSSKINLMYSN